MRNQFLKSNLICGFLLSICLTFISSITTFAKTNDSTLLVAQSISSEAVLLQKQKEIDQYVFEIHAKDILQKGFKVTHTAPLKDYIEIGITPYTKENAEYLYNIFGKDQVKIIEGQQAIPISASINTTATENKDNIKSSTTNFSIYVGIVAVTTLAFISFVIYKRKAVK